MTAADRAGPAQAPALRVTGLVAEAGAFDVEVPSLELASGEYFVLLGPSGHGKTVLLETLAGLREAVAGRVELDGRDATDAPPERRGVGLVYQGAALFPHLSVAANVAFGPDLRGAGRAERDDLVARAARVAGISDLLSRRPRSLSGGERQRVALARALASRPTLLVLDEPLSGLDPNARSELQDALRRVHDEERTTTIHVTHDFEEAVVLADRVGVMLAGRLRQVGPPDEVFRHPADTEVARFVGVRNVLRGRVEPDQAGEVTFVSERGLSIRTVGEARSVAHATIRPEDLVLSRDPIASSAANTLHGTVTGIERRGAVAYVTVQVEGDALVALVLVRSIEALDLQRGGEVCVTCKASAVHVL